MIKNKQVKDNCKICNKIIHTNQGLAIHLNKIHNKKFYEYILEFELNNQWPLCKCGCNEKVPLTHHNTKFGNYVHGHNKSFLNKHHTEYTKLKISETQSGKILTKEHSENISKGVSKCYLEGRFKHKCGKFYSNKNKKSYYYRSSWEKMFMEQLENDENVEKYLYEGFIINYELNNKIRRYLPDFLIYYKNKTRELIEIGQKNFKTKNLKEISKLNAAKEYCNLRNISFRILTEDYFK